MAQAAKSNSNIIIARTARTFGHLAAASYLLLMLAVGLPIWWRTTEVYRVTLPYAEIDRLAQDLQTRMRAELLLISSEDVKMGPKVQALLKDSSVYSFFLSSRHPFSEEARLLGASKDLVDLDSSLLSLHSGVLAGTVLLFHVQDNFLPSDGADVVVGRGRAVYFGKKTKLTKLISVVQEVMLGETAVAKTIASIEEPSHDKVKNQGKDSGILSNRGILRRTPAAAGYDILFSLLVPEPEKIQVSWNVPASIRAYVRPFLKQMSNLIDISVKSQVVYLQKLNIKSQKHRINKQRDVNLIRQKDLGLAINPVESQLSSHVSSNPRLNFLVYIPTVDQSPLHIAEDDKSKHLLESNAFLIPRWGGVLIHNSLDAVSNYRMKKQKFNTIKTEVDDAAIMGTFIMQLRLLLGLQDHSGKDNSTKIIPLTLGSDKTPPLHDWEHDYLLRLRTSENLHLTRATLQSLAHLLWQIPNIVIEDAIGEKVHESVQECLKASEELKLGRLEEAFSSSKKAFLASDAAFFDPSLLALLYFPEDQKYAIYIPLFLPVSIPVIMSLKSLYYFYYSKEKAE